MGHRHEHVVAAVGLADGERAEDRDRRPLEAAVDVVGADLVAAALDPELGAASSRLSSTTGAMKRYPLRGRVSINRGTCAESPSVRRIRWTAVFTP